MNDGVPAAARGVVLIGYRGSGKSTIGRALASRLGLAFVDADLEMRAQHGMDIAECFRRYGEAWFRDRESEVLGAIEERARRAGPLVLASGGGAILRSENVERLRRIGEVVWLRAHPETLRQRLAADPTTGRDRPRLSGGSALEEIDAVLRQRTPLYEAAAQLEFWVDPPRGVDEIVDEIARALGKAPAREET